VLEQILREILKKNDVKELVDRHLRVTPRAGHASKHIKLQSHFQWFEEHNKQQARANAQWQRIGSISHELMHFYCHHGFEAKSGKVTFGQVITEGFTELLGLELFDALQKRVTEGDQALIESLRGEAATDEFKQSAQAGPKRQNYEKALQRAREVQTRVGKNNVWAAYFLGKPELIGLA